jgi:hypothetical protein
LIQEDMHIIHSHRTLENHTKTTMNLVTGSGQKHKLNETSLEWFYNSSGTNDKINVKSNNSENIMLHFACELC